MGIELIKKQGQINLQKQMLRGDDGGYYTPSVDEDGNLTWTPSMDDMPEIEGANIKGVKGDKGDTGSVEWGDLTDEQIAALKGEKGDKGDDGYTPVKGVDYFDGEDGKDGADGKDGYTPVKGVDYFDGEDGADGKDGADGEAGLPALITSEVVTNASSGTKILFNAERFNRTPVVGDNFLALSQSGSGSSAVYYQYVYVISSKYDDNHWYATKSTIGFKTSGSDGADGAAGADGKDGADGYTPVKGTDYWTDEDKAEIVAATIAALPVYEGEVV